MASQRSVVRDGMRIDWDVPIEMDDGTVLRGDVYRPIESGRYPVLMTHGPYGKNLHFEQLYKDQWDEMCRAHPEVTADTTTKYVSWEVPDPEKWVPDDYAVVRIDSRGAGRSEGYLDVWSHREARDYATCVEWASEQPWSNGKIGLTGISYYAMNQWQVAALQPDGLAAICPWEGASDWYREMARHGGIHCTFGHGWYDNQVDILQHGVGANGHRSPMTGDWVAGPPTKRSEELGASRADFKSDVLEHTLATDDYWTSRTPDLSAIQVPLLSAANWGDHGLHLRGNIEGFKRAGSEQKWLEIHGREHWTEFYTDYGIDLQKRFFGHFLKGEDTGWLDQPRVQVQTRHPGERFEERHYDGWPPLDDISWRTYHLDTDRLQLTRDDLADDSSVTYDPFGDGVTFLTDPLVDTVDVLGPLSARLFVSSATEDADLFLVFRLFDASLSEVVFQGQVDPHKAISMGWLRASHRKLDPDRSTDWRPFHSHDERQPLTPGEIYELRVEILPTSIVAPAGSRLALSVRGTDYEYSGDTGATLENVAGTFTGVGPFRHDHPADRPPEIYGGDVTIHGGSRHPSKLTLPVLEST